MISYFQTILFIYVFHLKMFKDLKSGIFPIFQLAIFEKKLALFRIFKFMQVQNENKAFDFRLAMEKFNFLKSLYVDSC